MKMNFARGQWDFSLFDQITSLRTDGRKPFIQEDDCVVNDEAQKATIFEHNYISLLSREFFTAPCRLETVCSFESFGAPLLVFSDDIQQTEDGYPAYGRHIEIVAFEEGFNVWELNGTDKPILAGSGRFPVAAGEKLTLTAYVYPDRLEIDLNGNRGTVASERIPASFRAGITACEGVNRFYSFSAE